MALQTLEWPSTESYPDGIGRPDLRFRLIFFQAELCTLESLEQTRESLKNITFSSLSDFDLESKHNPFTPLFAMHAV